LAARKGAPPTKNRKPSTITRFNLGTSDIQTITVPVQTESLGAEIGNWRRRRYGGQRFIVGPLVLRSQ
jgi:hypothetical protein